MATTEQDLATVITREFERKELAETRGQKSPRPVTFLYSKKPSIPLDDLLEIGNVEDQIAEANFSKLFEQEVLKKSILIQRKYEENRLSSHETLELSAKANQRVEEILLDWIETKYGKEGKEFYIHVTNICGKLEIEFLKNGKKQELVDEMIKFLTKFYPGQDQAIKKYALGYIDEIENPFLESTKNSASKT